MLLEGVRRHAAVHRVAVEGIVNLTRWGQGRSMSTDGPSYRGYRYPPRIISHMVWLYHRFCWSLRDVEEVTAERGILVS